MRSWKEPAMVTASWPVRASATSKVSAGMATSRTAAHSAINSSSTWRRPAVSSRTTSWPCCAPAFIARRAMATALSPGITGSTSTSACTPRVASCSMAAGRLVSSEAISTRFLWLTRRNRPSLAVVVVLPEPWRPTMSTAAGGLAAAMPNLRGLAAQHLDKVIVHDLDHLLARGPRSSARRRRPPSRSRPRQNP